MAVKIVSQTIWSSPQWPSSVARNSKERGALSHSTWDRREIGSVVINGDVAGQSKRIALAYGDIGVWFVPLQEGMGFKAQESRVSQAGRVALGEVATRLAAPFAGSDFLPDLGVAMLVEDEGQRTGVHPQPIAELIEMGHGLGLIVADQCQGLLPGQAAVADLSSSLVVHL